MTKSDHVIKTADDTGITQYDVNLVIDAFLKNLKTAAGNGESTFIRGFGTFGIKERKAKVARNITKGTSMPIPAKNIVQFKPSPDFKVKQN